MQERPPCLYPETEAIRRVGARHHLYYVAVAAADFLICLQYQAEQFAECRVDHYQTPNEVHVSVFAKQADKERSQVTVEETQVGTAMQ